MVYPLKTLARISYHFSGNSQSRSTEQRFSPRTCEKYGLVIGGVGYIGKYLLHFLKADGTDYKGRNGLLRLDLENPHFDFPLKGYQYGVIAAGIARPLLCEQDPKRSYRINVEKTLELGQLLSEKGIVPVFFSTDYVFDGKTGNYDVDSPTAPLNEYGRQKAELERLALAHFGRECLIIRLSKVYGLEKGDGTLIDEMACRFARGQTVPAAVDQTLSPVSIHDIAKGMQQLLQKRASGLFQFAGSDRMTRFELANSLAKKMNKEHLVRACSIDEADGVVRPKNTAMHSHIPSCPIQEAVEHIAAHYCHE